ncbi:hypothetical protein [Clavibacter michiganensis]|uniref:hypothetical protein n=1 Tax=Clavibacter michiganensis TaxID=28447 RepID=UPI0011B0BA0B|nr:hypothetical protein [Clavibacter michiganensis]
MKRRSSSLAVAGAALLLAGCTTASAAPTSDAPEDELTATVLVLEDEGGSGPMMCAGAVAASSPPGCAGPAIDGWNWSDVDDETSESGVTWGDYVVFGTWDGTRFTMTRPAEQAPANANEASVPRSDPADQDAVTRATEDYSSRPFSPTGMLAVGDRDGRATVDVFYDDGTMQVEADALYGEDVVVVTSALRPA